MNGDNESISRLGLQQPNADSESAQNNTLALTDQQLEEERLRSDIFRYLVNKSSGVFHYSVQLRTITLDIIGVSYKATPEEFRNTENCLLDLLYTDPQRRFAIIGERDHIFVKRAPLDEDQINKLVEEWRCLIASFLFESKRIVCLSDIGSSVRRPISIPSSVKLIYIIKSDPLNRFVLQGEGNVAKVRFNMQTDPDQESLWVAKWRDDIASFLTKQQWSSPSIGIEGIESHIMRPFFLHPGVQLLDVLAADPFQRFVIMGFGVEARVTIRTFRGDEPEIEKYVEHWRKLIINYLLSKNDVLGASHLPVGLSKIGAYVARPIGVPASVKLIDIMRTDPLNRFTVNGDGNALRVMLNADSQHTGLPSGEDDEKRLPGQYILNNRLATMNNLALENKRHPLQDNSMGFNSSTTDQGAASFPARAPASNRLPSGTSSQITGMEPAEFMGQGQGLNSGPGPGPPNVSRYPVLSPQSPSTQNYNNRHSYLEQNQNQNQNQNQSRTYPYMEYFDSHSDNNINSHNSGHHQIFDPLRIRQEHLLQVQQFHQRSLPPHSPQSLPQQIQQNLDNNSGKSNSHSGGLIQSQGPRSGIAERDRMSLLFNNEPASQSGRRMSLTSDYDCGSHSDFDDMPRSMGTGLGMGIGSLERFGFEPVRDSIQSYRNPSMAMRSTISNDGNFAAHGDENREDLETSASLVSYADNNNTNSNSHSQELSLGHGFGSIFRDGFGVPSDTNSTSLQPPPAFLAGTNLSMTFLDDDPSSLSFIPPHKWMIKAWLPIAFEGFDIDVIDYFICKLRDDGGFVTLQDLLDARASNELTREVLADIAGFKLGHYNRLEKALAAADRERSKST